MSGIKEALKNILPPPVHAFNREVSRILEAIKETRQESQKLQQLLMKTNADALQHMQKEIAEQQKSLLNNLTQIQMQFAKQATVNQIAEQQNDILDRLARLQAQIAGQVSEKKLEDIDRQIKILQSSMEQVKRQAVDGSRHAAEAVWAQIFNLTISDNTWLKDKAFSPGRWAVGYPYLYVMYRVLNETHPKHILELGLGQSTRMISQYAAAYDDVEHIVVEHDLEWIQFFCNSYPIPANTQIVQLNREMIPYKEAEAVRVFKGFKEKFQGKKFDFISIDAPFGGDMKQYSRIDVLKIMPECLTDNFIIMIDDTNRSGETRTLNEMEQCLKKNQIDYKRGRYNGDKNCEIICTAKMAFLCSM